MRFKFVLQTGEILLNNGHRVASLGASVCLNYARCAAIGPNYVIFVLHCVPPFGPFSRPCTPSFRCILLDGISIILLGACRTRRVLGPVIT